MSIQHLPDNLFSVNDEFAKFLGIDPDFDTSCRLLLVVGPNACGKSFLRRIISMNLHPTKGPQTELIHLSQQDRSSAGGGEKPFIYGSEDWESTGYITARTFWTGMKTSRGRNKSHVLLWDEPEIGMGEELQLGTSQWLAKQLTDWPKHLLGVVLLTHSRIFVENLKDFPETKFFSFDGHKNPQEWLDRKILPVQPEEVLSCGIEKFRTLSAWLNRRKK